MTKKDCEAAMFGMWLLISSSQMFTQLLSVENQGEIDFDSWVPKVVRKLELYLQEKDK